MIVLYIIIGYLIVCMIGAVKMEEHNVPCTGRNVFLVFTWPITFPTLFKLWKEN